MAAHKTILKTATLKALEKVKVNFQVNFTDGNFVCSVSIVQRIGPGKKRAWCVQGLAVLLNWQF